MSGALARPALAQGAKVLRYIPQANLANPDPIWTTATVASLHGYMVWDTLYGIDGKLLPQPQMVAGHQIDNDGRLWTLTLRDGLLFHDGEKVRSTDCIPSIQRWGKRNTFGQQLMSLVEEMKPLDDRRFTIRLSRAFPQLPYALGATGCFIMPERMARTDPFKQIDEYVGSGPFRFLRNEWVAGASAAWAKFDKYVPRQEPPSYWAGGKVVHFDKVEWKIMPDPSTAAAALQTGEVDWWENPLFDLVPMLARNDELTLEVQDPLGALGIIAMNHEQPPFDNVKMRQALLHVVDQNTYLQAVLGEQAAKYGKTGAGFFTLGSPYANDAALDTIMGRRDIDLARKMVQEAGYKGEEIVLMSPSDQAQLQAMAQVTADVFKKVGLNVKYESMDWGTLVSRRAMHKKVAEGGWNSFCTTWGGLSVSNPGASFPLRGNGAKGWFGWPTDAAMETLRDAWFVAPDLAAQQEICRKMQVLAFRNVPFIPVGQWFTPTAYRKTLTGFVHAGLRLFWGVRPA